MTGPKWRIAVTAIPIGVLWLIAKATVLAMHLLNFIVQRCLGGVDFLCTWARGGKA